MARLSDVNNTIHSCGDENQFSNGALKKIENIRWLFRLAGGN
jgi:hypothetical protein